jgi:DNA-binding CsgD family transcriptional regulator
MQVASKPLPIRKRPALSDAKLAYFEGDFERCLDICSGIHVGTLASASEVALITARAYLRSGRAREAHNTIVAARETHTTLDACLTSQMLEASALIRQGNADSGIALVLDAAAASAGAHFAIRSEIAFCTALGYWTKREIQVAESFLERVDPRSDIIHARALELQAWCHDARGDYQRAAEFFRLTLLRLDDCQASDRAIAATALSMLTIFAAELFDRDIARYVETRVDEIGWSSSLNSLRYVILEYQALFAEFDGDTLKAYHLALRARESASTGPDDVFGWALQSSIARNAGDACSAVIFAQRAQERLQTLDLRELSGEERFALLSVAENCAHFDPDGAAELFAAYASLPRLDAIVSLGADPRGPAHEHYVAGVIAQARGETARAASSYRKAFDAFRALGYVRRAIIAANALLQLSDDDDLHAFIRHQIGITRNHITKELTAPADNAAAVEGHPVVAALPRAQREIVILICSGKTNKEIAQLRNVGEQTIKNMLTKSIFPAFGVSSRVSLVSACLRQRHRTWPERVAQPERWTTSLAADRQAPPTAHSTPTDSQPPDKLGVARAM